ncbi:hypothetical protein J3R83DRAFT_5586 [Lanmaoa asiatica]|nr:hypothetical protein J3R83DRAFT_5586 [Lanmaoa asiatica]
MFTPHQRELYRALDSMYETVNPGTHFDIIPSVNGQWAEPCMHWPPVPPVSTIYSQPMSFQDTYQRELRREMETLFEIANHTMITELVPSNDMTLVTEGCGPSAEVEYATQTAEAAHSSKARPHIATRQITHSCFAVGAMSCSGAFQEYSWYQEINGRYANLLLVGGMSQTGLNAKDLFVTFASVTWIILEEPSALLKIDLCVAPRPKSLKMEEQSDEQMLVPVIILPDVLNLKLIIHLIATLR